MASEQSSQSHLPPAWPDTVDSTPSWANESLGTSPRLPLPQDEHQQGNGSPLTSPGNGWDQASAPQTGNGWDQPATTTPGNGWEQAGAPQTGNGWDQATATPTGNGWSQATSAQTVGNGWDGATASQHSGQGLPDVPPPDSDSPSTSPGNGWGQASAPQTGTGWDQATATPTGNGWDQASAPQTGNGWDQASAPQTGNGWDQASAPQTGNGWDQPATTTPGNGWEQAGAPQAGNGWDQATATPTGNGWDQPSAPQPSVSATTSWSQAFTPQPMDEIRQDPDLSSERENPYLGATAPASAESWQVPPSSSGEPGASFPAPATDSVAWAPAAQTPPADSAVWPPASAENTGWPSTAPADNAGWPPAAQAENTAWPPTAPADSAVWPPASAENTGWPPAAPAENTGWASSPSADGTSWPSSPPAADTAWPSAAQTPPADNAVWPPAAADGASWSTTSPAEARDPLFSPTWQDPQAQAPAVPLGHPPAGGDALPGNGASFGDGAARSSFGVPNNPAVWALAATTAPEASPAAESQGVMRPAQGAPPQYPSDGAHQPQAQPLNPGYQPQPGQFPQGQPGHPGQPGPGHPGHPPQGQPGQHLSQDPSDPYKPFVTAGQISGPKTPPPERQQELWDTVFGDNYQAMGDDDEFDGQGRPIWVFALVGSVVIALVGALLWAFLAGPLASTKEADPTPQAKPSPTAKRPVKSQTIGRLPRFPGKASPVAGTLSDQAAAISVARLGGAWREDQRRTVPTVYGFTTRQYVPAGTDSAGRAQFAQLMSGALSPRLKDKYTSPENLAPVVNAVASEARKKFFPEGNSARKTAQQALSVNGLPGQLAAYEVTAGEEKTTMVVAVVSTGADLPSVVYMSVPDSKKDLLPDINTAFKSIKAASS
ncbi:hypothetical protein AB0395_35570 [Streptosporangium sp. NPDC051023]|uniref:hypothetical protein n=1 Tax=Streptosporangium sp. NPDC051023 TaxID=3155410 RepID=UPI00344EEB84